MNTLKGWHAPLRKTIAQIHLLLWLVAGTALTACDEQDKYVEPEEPETVWLLDRLYFGRSMPEEGVVSEADWDSFIAETVTPRFPEGLTFWLAEGQFQDASGVIIQEPSFVLEIVHEKSEESNRKLEEIIEVYKERFRQESVLRVTEQVEVEF